MPVTPAFRVLALVAVATLGLTGCAGDQRGALTALEAECAAAAVVTERLIDSGGDRDAALVAHLVALGEVASSDVRDIAEELVSLADVDEPSSTSRTTWYAALDALDQALLDRCEFSIRALVADAGLRSDSSNDDGSVIEAATDSSTEADLETGRPLDWNEVQSRVGSADWLERGYRGIVGLGPGIHVSVHGVETAQLALTVCNDVREALATEASASDVAIEVHGLHESLLVQDTGRACIVR